MYAVIKTGGKQYKVAAGQKIKIEQIPADVGQEITIEHVLAVGEGAELKVGTPLVGGATVVAKVLAGKSPAGRFVPERTFDEIVDVPDWSDFLIRMFFSFHATTMMISLLKCHASLCIMFRIILLTTTLPFANKLPILTS